MEAGSIKEEERGREWEMDKAETLSPFLLITGMPVKSRSLMFIKLKIHLKI